MRGRAEAQVWGLPGLTDTDQWDVDNDSPLLLRQMYLTSLAYKGMAGDTLRTPRRTATALVPTNAPRSGTPWSIDTGPKRETPEDHV